MCDDVLLIFARGLRVLHALCFGLHPSALAQQQALVDRYVLTSSLTAVHQGASRFDGRNDDVSDSYCRLSSLIFSASNNNTHCCAVLLLLCCVLCVLCVLCITAGCLMATQVILAVIVQLQDRCAVVCGGGG